MSIENAAEKTILLAVDDSENAKRAVDYVGSFLRNSSNGYRLTLLHIIRLPEPGAFATEEEKGRHLEKKRRKAEAFMTEYRERLLDAGVPASAITIRVPFRSCPSLAESILSERDIAGYSTVVVGRHKLTRTEEFLYGRVSGRLINHADNCAVGVIS